MTNLARKSLPLLVAISLVAPLALLAADKTADDNTLRQSQQAPADGQNLQERMQTMWARMTAMQATNDPQARLAIMNAQMQEMQTMMQDLSAGCPMAGAQGMMGGMGGMMAGHMMGGGMGSPMMHRHPSN